MVTIANSTLFNRSENNASKEKDVLENSTWDPKEMSAVQGKLVTTHIPVTSL
jgi:hypothetical protein